MPAAGKYQHRCTILRIPQPDAADSIGQLGGQFQPIATRWCNKVELSGREFWQAAQARSDISVRVEMRYFEGLNEKDQLKIDGQILNIVAVTNPDGRQIEHHVFCKQPGTRASGG